MLRILVLVLLGGWIYVPALSGDWLWDDYPNLVENAVKHDPDGLRKIWFQPGSLIEYYPIEASVQWLQWRCWHAIPFGYHATNIGLHIVSAFLLWRLFLKLGLRFAWWGAVLFLVHPANVESVAWISELKNTLSMPLFLLAMGAWIDYEASRKNYAWALGFFAAAMLCKITMIMFPVVILLYAWWKRGRVEIRTLKDCAPFFAISLMLGLAGLWVGARFAQNNGLVDTVGLGGAVSRIAGAGLALWFYLFKCLWPVGLSPIYPQWKIDPPALLDFLPWLTLVGLCIWFYANRRGWGRHAFLGLGFFVINLVPFLGFKAISYMRFTPVMDHFLYIPMIGLIGLAIAGWESMDKKFSRSIRPVVGASCLLIVLLLAMMSHGYATIFASEESLWTYTIQRNSAAWPAYTNLGNVMLRKGRAAEALSEYGQAVRINPDDAVAHNDRGAALEQMGRRKEAGREYEAALRLAPGYRDAQGNLDRLRALP